MNSESSDKQAVLYSTDNLPSNFATLFACCWDSAHSAVKIGLESMEIQSLMLWKIPLKSIQFVINRKAQICSMR